ncbi:MAG: hypothetical protein KIT84_04665 [Labilithrix sp.]|nr:hypothetical protein [Labilithrix sp.]MCW5810279.1 hypothetical protein [Labilithrix sp.]
MATFEPRERRICVRIVYDGLGSAGKTTNLQQLASLFSAQRTTDLYSPATVDGHTLYFDWMQIHGGVACGFPLLCQVISVPGQVVLTERRRHLLTTADAVVYVCDSAQARLAAAREGFALIADAAEVSGRRPVIVVQANKQDQLTAASGETLRGALGLGGDVEVVEAIARDGIGVVDSFVTAVRGVTKRLQAEVDRGHARLPLRLAERPQELLDALDALDVDPEWAAEMLLEEAASSFAGIARDVLAPPPPPRDDGDTREHAPVPRADAPAGFVWPAHTARERLDSLANAGVTAAPIDADGGVRIEVAGVGLTTSRAECFIEAEQARQSIVRAARELTQLGPLLAPETVLALQPGDDGRIWLWTVTPALEPSAAWLAAAAPEEQPARVAAIAAAVAEALAYTAHRGVELETSLDGFAVERDHVRYVGPRRPATPASLSKMVERALRSMDQLRHELHPFATALEHELRARSLDVGFLDRRPAVELSGE